MPPLSELNNAAANVISILKSIPEYSSARVAVIGGLAVWNYLQRGRTTEDVDLIVNIESAPSSVKQKLLNLPSSPFMQQAQYFYYKNPYGSYIQVDITPGWQSPYMPAAAERLDRIPNGTAPCISQTDLIIFKICSCGLRSQVAKRRLDAADSQTLLENMPYALRLTPEQQAIVEPCIADVVAYGTETAEWWKQRLGLAPAGQSPSRLSPARQSPSRQSPARQSPARQSPPRQASSAEYWTWSEDYKNYYHYHSDGTYEWATQARP
ncbi:MAG: hypothetical protein M1829_001975 [Trizodia sp. TS-e1964]|nr:MAG: hypothetical protein M1829_001975 [Trizodia sp. TS-e1964]